MSSPPAQTAVTEQTVPYKVLTQGLVFQNSNELQWWHSTAPILSKLLLSSQYDIHQQYQFLIFFREHIIPVLGPVPRRAEGTDMLQHQWNGVHLTGLNLEFSYNLTHAMVRLAVEPVGALAGTDEDPFNTAAIWDFLQRLSTAPLTEKFDTRRFRQFAEALIASEEELGAAMAEEAEGPQRFLERVGPRRTQTLIAMDLNKSGKILGKGYLYPQIKSLITGVPIKRLFFDAIRASDPEGVLATQLANLEEYLDTRRPDASREAEEIAKGGLSLCLLGCDLVPPATSRVKLYGIDEQVDWENIEGIWTFNGRRTDPESLKGLELCRKLWDIMPLHEGFCPLGMDVFVGIGAETSAIRCPMMVHYNLAPGIEFPEPQVYLPTFGVRDVEVLDALTVFFESQGWTDMAKFYKANFVAAYPNEDLSTTRHICAWVSFAYKNESAYMSIYNHSFEPVGEEMNGTGSKVLEK
ncbi:hypothetical protein FE257_010277 [Aspergillus nanangensis]|uniref:Uncharacterized protein n=1 Tax=Aspergillus nanangensis TaxID=2582783 RepID=A0AAD4CJH2_ASPNN|nr:hypothetical protein FE257_010277 [Aspergillus nanangensis]